MGMEKYAFHICFNQTEVVFYTTGYYICSRQLLSYMPIFSIHLLTFLLYTTHSLQKLNQQASRVAYHLLNMETQLPLTKHSPSYTRKNVEVMRWKQYEDAFRESGRFQ